MDSVLFSVDGLDVVVCATRSSRKRAYELRYRAYRAANAIPENARLIFKDAHDRTPNHRTFLVLDEGRPVATIRSGVYTPLYGWSSTEALLGFSQEITRHLGHNVRFVESNRFAVAPGYRGQRSTLAKLLCFRIQGLNAVAHGCEHVMTCVPRKHTRFYRRFLSMAPICDGSKRLPWLGESATLISAPVPISRRTAVRRGMPDYDDQDVEAFMRMTGLGMSPRPAAGLTELNWGVAR